VPRIAPRFLSACRLERGANCKISITHRAIAPTDFIYIQQHLNKTWLPIAGTEANILNGWRWTTGIAEHTGDIHRCCIALKEQSVVILAGAGTAKP
jgi:hypothetical protein